MNWLWLQILFFLIFANANIAKAIEDEGDASQKIRSLKKVLLETEARKAVLLETQASKANAKSKQKLFIPLIGKQFCDVTPTDLGNKAQNLTTPETTEKAGKKAKPKKKR